MTAEKPHVRDVLDRYYTPDVLAVACVRALDLRPEPSLVLEPSLGGGAFARAVRARWPKALIQGVDIDPDAPGREHADHLWTGDFRDHPFGSGFSLVIGNPPYRDAEAHVEAALALAPEVAMLLRLGLLAGQKRSAFWRAHPPAVVHVLSRRPSFTGGGTDASEYGWFVWSRQLGLWGSKEPVIRWLDWGGE